MRHYLRRNEQAALALTLVVVLALFFAACQPGDSIDQDFEPEPSPSPTAAEGVLDSDGDGVPDEIDECPDEAEDGRWSDGSDGCPDDIDDLMAAAVADIDAFWAAVFRANNLDYASPRNARAYTGPEQTGCGETIPNNAFYCGADHSIYFDRALLDRALQEVGDMAVVYILAHEWGHLIQAQLGVLNDPSRSSVNNELQADCFAGVYAGNAERRDLLDPGDVEEAQATAYQGGDPGGRGPASHGSPEQRSRAFTIGYEGSLQDCLQI